MQLTRLSTGLSTRLSIRLFGRRSTPLITSLKAMFAASCLLLANPSFADVPPSQGLEKKMSQFAIKAAIGHPSRLAGDNK